MSAHVAGPVLDRLVAVKVMGWTLEEKGKWCRWNKNDGNGGTWFPFADGRSLFGPSTNIANAWEVVEAMEDWLLSLYEDTPGTWAAAFESGNRKVQCVAATPSLAICRAALRAIGAA